MLVKLDHFPHGRKYLKMFETTTWETIRQPLPGSLTKKGHPIVSSNMVILLGAFGQPRRGISSHFNEMCKTSFTRRWFKVTFSSPSSRSLNCLKGLEELSPHPKTSPFSSSTEVWPSAHATPFTTDLWGISKICADLIWLIWIGTWGFTHDGLAFYRPLVFDAKEFLDAHLLHQY